MRVSRPTQAATLVAAEPETTAAPRRSAGNVSGYTIPVGRAARQPESHPLNLPAASEVA